MKNLTFLAVVGVLAMMASLGYALLVGSFSAEGRQLLTMPWGVVSLVDLYVGFVVFACWILYREGNSPKAWTWIALVMGLGSLAICIYVLLCIRSSRGNARILLLGRNSGG